MPTFNQLGQAYKPRRHKRHYNKSRKLLKRPQLRAVCVKVYTMKPKKPNSAIRKIAKIKLSTNVHTLAYIPGQGHNLQQHSVVMIRGGKVPDLNGIHYHIIRGKYDFTGKERFERTNARSKYGLSKIKDSKVI